MEEIEKKTVYINETVGIVKLTCIFYIFIYVYSLFE